MAERPEYWVAWLVDGEGGQIKRAAESLNLIEAEIKKGVSPLQETQHEMKELR